MTGRHARDAAAPADAAGPAVRRYPYDSYFIA